MNSERDKSREGPLARKLLAAAKPIPNTEVINEQALVPTQNPVEQDPILPRTDDESSVQVDTSNVEELKPSSDARPSEDRGNIMEQDNHDGFSDDESDGMRLMCHDTVHSDMCTDNHRPQRRRRVMTYSEDMYEPDVIRSEQVYEVEAILDSKRKNVCTELRCMCIHVNDRDVIFF